MKSLKQKIACLKSNPASDIPSLTSQILQENFELEKYVPNLIVYSIPESSSPAISERVENDKSSVFNIFKSLGNTVPTDIKLIHLGRSRSDTVRPLKLICGSEEVA